MSNGTSLVTKGLIGGGGGSTPTEEPTLDAPPSEPVQLESSPQGSVMIVVPTAVNVALMAAENITDNLRKRQPASLALPSLYKRAYLVAHETDEIAVIKEK